MLLFASECGYLHNKLTIAKKFKFLRCKSEFNRDFNAAKITLLKKHESDFFFIRR